MTDAQAVFAYFKKGAHTGPLDYEQDLNLKGIKDGVEYDAPWWVRARAAHRMGP